MKKEEQSNQLKKSLLAIRKAIRKKVFLLKLNDEKQERTWNKQYAAITNSLQNLQNIARKPILIKNEPNESKSEHSLKIQPKTDHASTYLNSLLKKRHEMWDKTAPTYKFNTSDNYSDTELVDQPLNNTQNETSIKSAVGTVNKEAYQSYLDQYNELPKHYLNMILLDEDNGRKFDKKYGININLETDEWRLGNKVVNPEGNDLLIGKTRYKGTPGLYELLFMKDPTLSIITEDDKKQYSRMLTESGAAFIDNNPKKRPKGNASNKYKKLIKPYIRTPIHMNEFAPNNSSTPNTVSKIGYGKFDATLRYENKPYRAIYWDDPNELVERLWLLHASNRAGNHSHNNEIIAIEEELREAGYIN